MPQQCPRAPRDRSLQEAELKCRHTLVLVGPLLLTPLCEEGGTGPRSSGLASPGDFLSPTLFMAPALAIMSLSSLTIWLLQTNISPPTQTRW